MYQSKLVILFIFLIKSCSLLCAQNSDSISVSLKDLFELADENNRDLKILSYAEKIALESINDQKKKLLPSLDASLSFSYNGDGTVIDRNFSHSERAPIPDFGNSFIIAASQVIYAGGAIKNSIEIAKLEHTASILTKENTKQNIRFTIVGHYLELLKLKNQETILKKNIIQTKTLLEQIRSKYEQGTMLENNVTRYELQLQSLELSSLQVENRITITSNDLKKMLQLPHNLVLIIDDSILNEDLSIYNITELQHLASNNSPIIKQENVNINKAKKSEKLINADKMPQVFAFAENNMTGPITIEIPAINKNFNYWYVGIGVKYNIGALYKNKAKARQAKLAIQMATEQREKIEEDVNNNLEDILIGYNEAIRVYETQLKNIELATQNYEIVRNRYLNDLVLITEMLDAENSKLDSELRATNAQINIIFQYYQLKKTTGTL